jgi:gas vesicle protein
MVAGGINAAFNGGNIGQGMLMGGAIGGVMGAISGASKSPGNSTDTQTAKDGGAAGVKSVQEVKNNLTVTQRINQARSEAINVLGSTNCAGDYSNRLMGLLDKATIIYAPGNNCGEISNLSDFFSNRISVGHAAFDDPVFCGKPASTLLHEAVHLMWSNYFNIPYREIQAYAIEDQCFGR